jgi:putative membrane protein
MNSVKNIIKKDKYSLIRWLILVLIIITSFLRIENGGLAIIVYLLPTIFIFMHGSRFLGKKNITIFFVVVCIATFIAEYLGVNTGRLFGEYYYNSVGNGPLLGGVPPLLMLTYFSITYGTYWIIRILLGDFGVIKGAKILWLSILGGLIATLTDLAADPVNSTVNQVYIWTKGGIFFGVPYENFTGWLLEIAIAFIIISVIFGYITKSPKLKSLPSKNFQLQPIILFAAPVLPIILRPIWGEQPADIRAAMSLIALFGLGSLIVVSILKIYWKNNKKI